MTAEASQRGWWRRLRANTRDESPWDLDEVLPRLKLEVTAVRRRAAKVERPKRRRKALKTSEVSS